VIIGYRLTKISPFALLVVVWQTYDQAFGSHAFNTIKGDNMIFVVFISIALYILFNTIAFLTSIIWLPKEDTISVCYCVPAKSPASRYPSRIGSDWLTCFSGSATSAHHVRRTGPRSGSKIADSNGYLPRAADCWGINYDQTASTLDRQGQKAPRQSK
jgi:sodium/bile acid cotransporter family protein DUF4137